MEFIQETIYLDRASVININDNSITLQFNDSIMYKFYCITFTYDSMENFVRLNQLMFI